MLNTIRDFSPKSNPNAQWQEPETIIRAFIAAQIVRETPSLTARGFLQPSNAGGATLYSEERKKLTSDQAMSQLQTALAFLSRSAWKDGNSYSLKHQAEVWAMRNGLGSSHYVSNGAMIAAAMALALDVRPAPVEPDANIQRRAATIATCKRPNRKTLH